MRVTLEGFFRLSPIESKDQLNDKIESLRNDYAKLKKRQKEASSIQLRKECELIEWKNDFSISLSKLNEAFMTSLQSHHQQAQQKLAEHIQTHFKSSEKSEVWIRQGLAQNNSETCQFCGQRLSNEAKSLLDVYRQSFDTAYENHDKHIQQALEKSKAELLKDRTHPLKIIIATNTSVIMSYPELSEDNQLFRSLQEQIMALETQLSEDYLKWEQLISSLNNEVESLIIQKLASSHKAIDALQCNSLLEVETAITEKVAQYNKLIADINLIYHSFKASLVDATIDRRLIEIERDGKLEKRKLQRIQLSEQCTNYLDFDEKVKKLKVEIPSLEEQLATEQSQFMENYFDRLNKFFRLFGSHDFQLEKGLDTRGHKPIYYLKVKLHEHDIPDKNLDCVFSESDRRSLALSVFWAALDGLSKDEKKKCIVVLDDPVTSFDNHRISMVHQEIVKLSEDVRQVILLSHFEEGVTRFLNTYRNNKTVKLLSIERNGSTSELKVTEIEQFIKTAHEKVAHNIFCFINKNTNSHNAGDLRVFLENEINLRFAQQLAGIDERNLADRINRLKEIGGISEETASLIHDWRETLNPTHHKWINSDIEDQRHTASQFMEFVYNRLIPK